MAMPLVRARKFRAFGNDTDENPWKIVLKSAKLSAFQPAHDLVGNCLNCGFRISIGTGNRWFGRRLAGDARAPLVIIAKLAFLEAESRIHIAEALLDLQQILEVLGLNVLGVLPSCDATKTVRQYASMISMRQYASSMPLWLQETTP